MEAISSDRSKRMRSVPPADTKHEDSSSDEPNRHKIGRFFSSIGISSLMLVFFSINAYISFIKSDQAMWYRACKTCNKRVSKASGSDYWCEACGNDDDQCSLRGLSPLLSDFSPEFALSLSSPIFLLNFLH